MGTGARLASTQVLKQGVWWSMEQGEWWHGCNLGMRDGRGVAGGEMEIDRGRDRNRKTERGRGQGRMLPKWWS